MTGHIRADARKRNEPQPPTDAERLAAIIARCREANDYGVVSSREMLVLAGGGS